MTAPVEDPDALNPIGELRIARDRRLVRGLLAGDQRALKAFYDEYFPKLYRYAARRMSSSHDIDEVIQSVLTIAARRIETYRGEAALLTWLIRICRNEVAKFYHAHVAENAVMIFLDDDVMRAAIESMEAPPLDEPESAARRGELVARVQLALDQLPERYADVLQLKYFDGYSSKEIAAKFGINDEAVQSLLARARRAFREICSLALTLDFDAVDASRSELEQP